MGFVGVIVGGCDFLNCEEHDSCRFRNLVLVSTPGCNPSFSHPPAEASEPIAAGYVAVIDLSESGIDVPKSTEGRLP